MSIDTCIDVCIDVCLDTCLDMCACPCIDMCIDMCRDVCIDICVHRHAYRHVYRNGRDAVRVAGATSHELCSCVLCTVCTDIVPTCIDMCIHNGHIHRHI